MSASLKSLSSRSRQLLLTFGVVTLLPTIGLIWLAFTLVNQDRELAVKQLRDYLERRADDVIGELRRDLSMPSASQTEQPSTKRRDVQLAAFATGNKAEQANRIEDALREYRRVAGSSDAEIRAEALIRVARVLRKAGRSDEALAVWEQLKSEDDVQFLGSPVSLEAALARVREFEARGQESQRDIEAAAIRKDLERGRWRIDRFALEAAWTQVAGPQTFAAEWQKRWRDAGLAISLTDASGAPVVETGALSGPAVVRSPAESKLPWTLRVASATPGVELQAFASRRRNLFMVLALAAFLVLAGAYFVTRGIRRELTVAQLQSSFVSAVSHEFRTPLTSMSHLIELLRDRERLDDTKRTKYYDALEQEAGRLRGFVDRLLDFGRVDAGAAQYKFEPTDPAELVGQIVDRFRTGPTAQSHEVSLNAAAVLPQAAIDRESFALALNNLLENAAKYSLPGRRIAVETSVASGGRLAIHVRDQGPGIPRTEQRLIFDKFVRGASAHTAGIRGTGVGLALARDIIRAHGGDIAVESEPGRGSTFTILL